MDIVLDVRGGVTYAGPMSDEDEFWHIGFDCNHCDDSMETCTLTYVINQCESLAKQIAYIKGV